MNKKILLTIILGIFLIGFASAELTTFDNKLTYADNDLTVTIYNLFGLGSEIGEVTLKSHKTVDEVLKFGFGQEEALEPQEDYDDWLEHRDGMRDWGYLKWKEEDKKKRRRR